MADPARPIRLVLAAASQPGPGSAGVGWAGRGAARAPSRGWWRRPGLLSLPGGGTVIADLGRLIFDDEGNATFEADRSRSPGGSAQRWSTKLLATPVT
jgi:hypothetical protein